MANLDYQVLRNELIDAIEEEEREEVERLLTVDPASLPNVFDSPKFRSRFMWKVAQLDQQIIRLLVEAGMDLNRGDSQNGGGIFPIHRCIREDTYDQAKFLLELGADPQMCDGLHWVIDEDKLSTESKLRWLELFVEYGANINAGTHGIPEYTPIMKAVDFELPELVEFFHRRGVEMPAPAPVLEYTLNLKTFQSRLEDACRACWNAMCGEFPDETFCLFGLETDSDYVILNGLLDTDQAIERDLRNRPKGESFVARISLDSDSEFYGKANHFFDELSQEMNSALGADLTAREDGKRIKSLHRCFEEALKNLDREGLFGKGEDRNRIILLVAIIDADKREWKTMLKTAKRLNPPIVYKQFISSLET